MGPKVKEHLEKDWLLSHRSISDELKLHFKSYADTGKECLEKARLVARGDLQKPGVDYRETYAPVVKFISLRVLLTFAGLRKFETRHFDIESAFLHSKIDDGLELYMQQPTGFADGTNWVCKLRKAIDGLCQAARQFYLRLDEILKEIGYSRLCADWAIWVCENGTFIAVHIDDIFAAGSEVQVMRAFEQINWFICMNDLGPMHRYLGLDISYVDSTFYVSQAHYIEKILSEFNLSSSHGVQTPMVTYERWDRVDSDLLDPPQNELYQSAIGMLLYVMHGTRPDISFPVIKLSQYASCPRLIHWDAVKQIIRYLKGTLTRSLALGIITTNHDPSVDNNLYAFFDSAHADNANKLLTCSYLFLLFGGLIACSTKVQRTVALSSTEAEYMAGTEAVCEAVWIKGLTDAIFRDSTLEIKWPIEIRGDNQGSLAVANNPQFHQRTKHITLRQQFISDMVDDGLISVLYVPTSVILADSLNKALPQDIHIHHWSILPLVDRPLCVAPATLSMALELSALLRKCKWPYVACDNLFRDERALKRHMVLKEL